MLTLEFLNNIQSSSNFDEDIKIDWWEQAENGTLWTRREGLHNQHETHYMFYTLKEDCDEGEPDPEKFWHYDINWIADDIWNDKVTFVKLGETRTVQTVEIPEVGLSSAECSIYKVLITINDREVLVGWVGKEVIIQLELNSEPGQYE